MGNKAILRVEKLGKRGNVAGSAAHNYRERPAHNADPGRAHLNEFTGARSKAELFSALNARLEQLDEVDPQAVPLAEFVITASPEAFTENGGRVNSKSYFDDVEAWLKQKYGAENVLGTCRHYDEKTPHMHAYVVPVRKIEAGTRQRSVIIGKDENGKTLRETREYPKPARSILSAKHHFDGRGKLAALQTKFAKEVGARYGLERGVEGSKARHQTLKRFYSNLQQPVMPIPQPPKIQGTDWLRAGNILAEYEQQLGAALKPLQARARDRDNQATHRSDPTDRTRAEAAEALNERNRKQLEHLQALLADADAEVAVGNDRIAQLQAEIERLTQEMAELRRVAEAQQAEIMRLRGADPDYDPLAYNPLAP